MVGFVAMQVVARRLFNPSKVPKAPFFNPFPFPLDRFLVSDFQVKEALCQWRTPSLRNFCSARVTDFARQDSSPVAQYYSMYLSAPIPRESFSFTSAAEDTTTTTNTEIPKEIYDKMLEFMDVKRTIPPIPLLMSFIENCQNYHDIKLLFKMLRKRWIFALSEFGAVYEFNSHICQQVTKACIRAGALDFGKKSVWMHNENGLIPTIESLHHLLKYAEDHNDVKHMVGFFKLIDINDLPLEPDTADIIFRICYNADNWKLLSKYSKEFISEGVKLHQTSFDTLMEFASKIGNVKVLWTYEKLRSETTKQHTLRSGFSCAKGHLLERKPEEAAAILQEIYQAFPNARSDFMIEIQKLVNEWHAEVIKYQKEAHRKELTAALKSCIPTMLGNLQNSGLEANVNMNNLNQ